MDKLAKLNAFSLDWKNPEHEFQDKRLERKRKKLLKVAEEFLNFLIDNTEAVNPRIRDVPNKLQTREPQRYQSTVEKLEKLGDQVVKSHQDLVRAGRKKLNM